MKKIPCLFVRDFSVRPALITKEVTEGCEWVIAGEGIATIKYDGTSVRITRDGGESKLWARYDSKKGKKPPPNWEPCQPEPDPITGHWPGWELVVDQPQHKWIKIAAANSMQELLPEGTYEAVGPKINGNPEHVKDHRLWRHGAEAVSIDPPPAWKGGGGLFEALKDRLSRAPFIEGIVFHHQDGRMAKIRRKDFGYAWPMPESESRSRDPDEEIYLPGC